MLSDKLLDAIHLRMHRQLVLLLPIHNFEAACLTMRGLLLT